MVKITKIGVVHNEIKEKLDPIKFKSIKSKIRLEPEFQDGLFTINENEYIMVIFEFHQARDQYLLKHHTRTGEFKGVFSSRSPNRPSSIGVSTVKLLECKANELLVEGLDAIDGTPVLDIKPYTPWFGGIDKKKEICDHIEKRNPRGGIVDKIISGDREGLLYYAGTLHGHYCSGLALGIHMAWYAMIKIREFSDGIMEDVIAIVEMNNCAADGVQYVTGCTFGNNALIYRDFGKMVLSLIRRSDGKGVRVALKPGWRDSIKSPRGYDALVKKVIRERSATEEEMARFKVLARDESFKLVNIPSNEILHFTHITVDLPPRAPIYDSFTCGKCGESTMDSRKINRDGLNLCHDCAAISYTQLTGHGFQTVNQEDGRMDK